MISSSNLVRPKVTSSNGRAMGRYEHKNRYQVLGADAEDEDDESEDSLAEPLVDTDVEVSDAEGGEPDDLVVSDAMEEKHKVWFSKAMRQAGREPSS